MKRIATNYWGLLVLLGFGVAAEVRAASEFETFLKPFFAEHCVKCHGEKKVKGKVNLKEIRTVAQFLEKPKLIKELIEAVDAFDMPPEDEPELDDDERAKLLTGLKAMLRQAASGTESRQVRMRRLNRFQYNNTVKDLFGLKRDVFQLQEKLMTRQSDYLSADGDEMPDKVEVACLSLQKAGGLKDVIPFPKDLRAAHGYDNQANQLSLSPLLLDTFLRLSVSILESPDFNAETVGIWNDFFADPPEGADVQAEASRRLEPFLRQAFRSAIEDETLDRYTAYVISKIAQGVSFPDSMKKAASAILSSPRFLFRHGATDQKEDLFVVASNLSFFLWGSGPDLELLRLAESGELADVDTYRRTIDRMMADPRIERFLDTFPSQWMQLENVLAATPDPKKARLFSLDRDNPASLQMVLEPLLLFDAVFIENRPIREFISPSFSYQSDLLRDWYKGDLKPEPIDEAKIEEINRDRVAKRQDLEGNLNERRQELSELDQAIADPIGRELVQVDLGPGQKKWEEEQAELVAESVELSPWFRLGPFQAANFEEAHAKAFIHEAAATFKEAHGKLEWEKSPGLADGKMHRLSGPNSATYLLRAMRSGRARPLELSLGSDDSFKLWMNGKLVSDRKVVRGLAPDQDKVRIDVPEGESVLLFKVANGGGEYGFYFKAKSVPLPEPVIAALRVGPGMRDADQQKALARHYLGIAPELVEVRNEIAAKRGAVDKIRSELEEELRRTPPPQDLQKHREEARRRFDDQMRQKMRSRTFERVVVADPRYGGVITNAAMLSMTSGPGRTHPIARGAWIIEVIFNDPPPPPPNDVPPLNEDSGDQNLTIREKFAQHRENPDCAGCHSRLDPLGFALENYDIVGRWRDKYENGRTVDSSGTLMRKYPFDGIVRFKESLVHENRRFAKAFSGHLLRFAISRELSPADSLTIDSIVDKAEGGSFLLKDLIREVALSESFVQAN